MAELRKDDFLLIDINLAIHHTSILAKPRSICTLENKKAKLSSSTCL